MSPLLTRTVFASVSVALTFAMVAASAPTSAATVPDDVHRAVVQIDDLNLASPAGQKTLDRRLNAAAYSVCPVSDTVNGAHCRAAAIERARTEIGQRTPVTAGAAS